MSWIGRIIMSFITPEIQALITKAVKEGGETAKLAEALKVAEERITAAEAVNADQKADLEAIAKAVQDGGSCTSILRVIPLLPKTGTMLP
jgi:DNA-binding FrmR family transcriptional regulator